MKKIVFVLGALLLMIAGCGDPKISTLKPAGEVGKGQMNLMAISAAIMAFVILIVLFLFVMIMIRFRRKKGDNIIPKQIEGSKKLELIWTTVPIILLIILAIPTVYYTYKFADTKAARDEKSDAVVINVRANQFWWEFEYPKEGVVTGQELVVPTDEKVYFNVTASDIKHSFWIPSAGGKIDTNPDNVNEIYLEFDQEKADETDGLFYGKCAELCGTSHALMDFKVRALPKDEYEKWLNEMRNTEVRATDEAPTPVDPMVAEGKEKFDQSCVGCHAVSAVDKKPASARLAPNLADFGDRLMVAGILENNEANIEKWLADPEEVKAGNKMTGKFGSITQSELDALAKYLMSLKLENGE